MAVAIDSALISRSLSAAGALEATIDEYHGHVCAIRDQLAREASLHESALRERDGKLSAYEDAISALGGSLAQQAVAHSPRQPSPRGRAVGSSNRASDTHGAMGATPRRGPSAALLDEQMIAQLTRVADLVERQRESRTSE